MMRLPYAFWPRAEHAAFGQTCFDASIGSVSVCIDYSMLIDACFFKPFFHFHRIVGSYPISAPVAFEDVQLSDAELQRITTPKLFVTSDQNDPFTSDTYHMFDVTPQPKEERIYPGRRHGLALFQGTSGPDLLSALRQFLQHYVPVN